MPSFHSSLRRLAKELEERAAVGPERERPAVFENGSYLLRISLANVSKPPVWRRLRVPSDVKFARLHRCIQAVMGWDNAHPHRFSATVSVFRDWRVGKVGNDGSIGDARVLHEVLRGEGVEIGYEYDFGDGWMHKIKVEEIAGPLDGVRRLECIGGKGACPPEDCGGSGGYAYLKFVIANPDHEDHERLVEWLGEGPDEFNPDRFDLALANRRLAGVR